MFLKHKTVRILLCAVLALLMLYSGISCAAIWHKAAGQPYLAAGAERLAFMGYPLMAALNGAGCLVSALLLAVFVRWGKRKAEPAQTPSETPADTPADTPL